MSIIDENALLIVGAGVSAPFGVPMGAQMIPRIRQGIHAGREYVYGREGRMSQELLRYIQSTYRGTQQFWEQPHWGVVLARHDTPAISATDTDSLNRDMSKLRALIDLLDGQTSETIDDFIVENPTYSEILKACIAVEIAKSTYTYNSSPREIVPDKLASRFLADKEGRPRRNWIHLLINLVRQAIRTGQLKDGQKIRIVSFNYDGILEAVLADQFQNTERPYPPYTEFFEIIHPHGLCGDLNQSPIKSPTQLFEWAQNICVVNEQNIQNETVKKARATANEWIKNASQVYAVGFAFAAPNCDLIGMRKPPPGGGRHLHYCNFDGNEGVRLSAEKCKLFKHQHPTNGTYNRPVSVEDWLYAGFLGEFSA